MQNLRLNAVRSNRIGNKQLGNNLVNFNTKVRRHRGPEQNLNQNAIWTNILGTQDRQETEEEDNERRKRDEDNVEDNDERGW